uniref:DDE-1 domain-containing protein n=1 Tax=Amphimedon queenslandica TaxID=400682 RepID=A0A1X7UB16_AMPQE
MAEQGSSQVSEIGKETKHEITVLLAVTASETVLPPQLIYQGRTVGCYSKLTFPTHWNVTHSEGHWSTTETRIEYLYTVLVPYVVETRQELELAYDDPALAPFDVFDAHCSSKVLPKLRGNNIHQIFVPALESCNRCMYELWRLQTVNESLIFKMVF